MILFERVKQKLRTLIRRSFTLHGDASVDDTRTISDELKHVLFDVCNFYDSNLFYSRIIDYNPIVEHDTNVLFNVSLFF